MWLFYALASALFAGIMSILAKVGIKRTDTNLATALRTIVVVIFAWLMVFIVGSHSSIPQIDKRSLIFLVLSGFATGGSWLCYFKALQTGDVNKVVPVDKSSTVLTMLLSFIFLGEAATPVKVCAMALIGLGAYLMIERKRNASTIVKGYKWLIYAILSAIFASLTAILGKIGITGVESNLGTAIRTVVVLIMAWLIVLAQGKHRELKRIDKRSWAFICLSGLATGLSWLCYYRALQEGPASVVVPIDKLSILVTVTFGYFVLHEKLKRKSAVGLFLLVAGTLSLLIYTRGR
ncbi:MAG: EamA family transporter [Oscillospiraceae bacterium]|jgi:transporter family protein|nr:EamA family transporter [Oscillospiraceae bacterium]